MKKTYDETILSAYIDGELDAATMHDVDLFIQKDEEAVRYMMETVRATALLRANVNAVLHEKIPQRLLDSLRPQQIARSRRKPLIRNLIRVVAVLILGFLGFGLGSLMERKTGAHLPAVITPLPARYGDVVDAALEYNLSGTPRKWLAPSAAVAITVTPVKTYRDKSGVYYREYKLEVAAGTEHSRINGLAYRAANGKWKTKVLYF